MNPDSMPEGDEAGLISWTKFLGEPNRHQIKSGGEIYRYINEEDFKSIQQDAFAAGQAKTAAFLAAHKEGK